MKFTVIKNVVNEELLKELKIFAEKIKYEPCSDWLGNYETLVFSLENITPFEIPFAFTKLAKIVLPLVETEQQYNRIVLQKHIEGSTVKPHFDPRDTKGYVVCVPFGIYEGGSVIIDNKEVEMSPGDVLLRNATIGFSMGPKHFLSAIESGTKYALEFSTTIKEESS